MLGQGRYQGIGGWAAFQIILVARTLCAPHALDLPEAMAFFSVGVPCLQVRWMYAAVFVLMQTHAR